MRYLFFWAFIWLFCFHFGAQDTSSFVQKILTSNDTILNVNQLESVDDFMMDTAKVTDSHFYKGYKRWRAKTIGRTNYTGSPQGYTIEDFSDYLHNNVLGYNFCSGGVNTNPWTLVSPVTNPNRRQTAGLITSIIHDPDNFEKVYAGTEMAGLFVGERSPNDNQFHWQRELINPNFGSIGVNSIEVLPANGQLAKRVLVGTFRKYSVDYASHGIYYKDIGNTTWTASKIYDEWPIQSNSKEVALHSLVIRRIEGSNSMPNLLLACGGDRVLVSTNRGHTWGELINHEPDGTNHTFTFTDIEFSLSNSGNPVALVSGNSSNQLSSISSTIIRLEFVNFNSSNQNQQVILQSTADFPGMAGASGTSGLKLKPTAIAVSSADPDYFYALGQTGKFTNKIYKLHYNSNQWIGPLATGTINQPSTYGNKHEGGNMFDSPVFELSDRPLEPGEQHIQTMYAGGYMVIKSMDGGNTWDVISHYRPGQTGPATSTHADIRGMSKVGFQNGEDILYMANDGGVSFSEASSNSRSDYWENINDLGLISLDAYVPGVYYPDNSVHTGAWHNGITKYVDGQEYNVILNDVGEVWVDNVFSDGTVFAVFEGTIRAFPEAHLGSQSSYGSALSDWMFNDDPLGAGLYRYALTGNRIEVNNQSEYMYFSGKRIYRKKITDGTQISKGSLVYPLDVNRPNISPTRKRENQISAYKVSEDGQTIYVAHLLGHGNGDLKNFKLYKTTTALSEPIIWENITGFMNNEANNSASESNLSWLKSHHINDFMIDPEDANIVFACFSDYSSSSDPARVVYSLDGGYTWKDFSDQLPLIPMNRLILRGGQELYVATDQGVYKGKYEKVYGSGGAVVGFANPEWSCFNNGLPNASVNGLRFNPCEDELIASTWGHGVFKVKLDDLPGGRERYITQNTLITNTKEFNESLIIPSGVVLRVEGRVVMNGFESFIKVMPGGSLIIDGGEVTSGCSDWKGIYVVGNSNLAQYNVNQGEVRIMNNGVISNARDGITTSDIDSEGQWIPATTGGLIYATNAQFINNRRDIQILPYYHSTGVYQDKYIARFYDCVFKKDNSFKVSGATMLAAITLWGVNDVRIQGCEFVNDNTSSFKHKGGAIFAINSSFSMVSNPNAMDSKVSGFLDGVRSINTLPLGYLSNIRIFDTEFTNNVHAIYLGNTTLSQIIGNSIALPVINTQPITNGGEFNSGEISFSSAQSANYGIYLDNSTDYQVELNTIGTMAQASTNCTTLGIVVNNSGGRPNRIFDNHLSGLDVGIQALGINASISTINDGLKFQCNRFAYGQSQWFWASDQINGIDIDVLNTSSNPFSGVARHQGDLNPSAPITSLPNNLFSPGQTPANFLNATANVIHYPYSESKPGLAPNTVLNVNVIPNQNASYLSHGHACSGLGKVPASNAITFANAASSDLSTLSNLKALKDQVTNGGMTSIIEAQILFANNQSDYIDLYMDLLAASPNVETEILGQVLEIDDFPELAIRNLFVSNPHAAREPFMMEMILTREPLLSAQTISDIEGNVKTITSYDLLLNDIAVAQSDFSINLAQSMRSFQEDSAFTVNDQAALLLGVNHKEAIKYRSGLYSTSASLQDAYDLLDGYLDTAVVSYEDSVDLVYNKMLINYGLNNFGINAQVPVDSMITILSASFADSFHPVNVVSSFTQLSLWGEVGLKYVEPIYYGNISNKKGTTFDVKDDLNRPPFISGGTDVFPIPTDGLLFISFADFAIISKEKPNCVISVSDISGRELFSESIYLEQAIQMLDLSSVTPGTYLVTVSLDGVVVDKHKIIVKKLIE